MSSHREGEVWESSEMANVERGVWRKPARPALDCPETLSVHSLRGMHASAEMGSLHELELTAGSWILCVCFYGCTYFKNHAVAVPLMKLKPWLFCQITLHSRNLFGLL